MNSSSLLLLLLLLHILLYFTISRPTVATIATATLYFFYFDTIITLLSLLSSLVLLLIPHYNDYCLFTITTVPLQLLLLRHNCNYFANIITSLFLLTATTTTTPLQVPVLQLLSPDYCYFTITTPQLSLVHY